MSHRFLLLLCVIALGLTACSRLPKQPPPPVALEQQPNLLAQKRFWLAEGKIALTVTALSDKTAPDAPKEYKESGNFEWQNQGGNYAIRFYGPLGLGAVKLTKEGKLVTFESAKEGTHSAESAEELMQRLAGWQVPISQLQHWIKGIPAPGAIESRQNDPSGQLLQLKQLGWTIDYSAYSQINGWSLPGKLIASRERVKVVMVMKNWQMTQAGE
ncbi:MAG: outer rane lipoprotein LolB [Pseudomonadota bacterium]|jgi:outer membrane lipoprotein LolB